MYKKRGKIVQCKTILSAKNNSEKYRFIFKIEA